MTSAPDHSILGRHPGQPLPTLDWPSEDKPKFWWGRDKQGNLTKVYRDYRAYCEA